MGHKHNGEDVAYVLFLYIVYIGEDPTPTLG